MCKMLISSIQAGFIYKTEFYELPFHDCKQAIINEFRIRLTHIMPSTKAIVLFIVVGQKMDANIKLC